MTSCGADSQDWFTQHVSDAKDRTIPSDCESLSSSGPVKSEWSITANWECDSRWNLAQYQQWVTAKLQPQFKILHSDASRLTAGRNLGGDFESVSIEQRVVGDKLRIHVVLSTYPD
jgi:hypothetical protein